MAAAVLHGAHPALATIRCSYEIAKHRLFFYSSRVGIVRRSAASKSSDNGCLIGLPLTADAAMGTAVPTGGMGPHKRHSVNRATGPS
jgi:hypothetical protein